MCELHAEVANVTCERLLDVLCVLRQGDMRGSCCGRSRSTTVCGSNVGARRRTRWLCSELYRCVDSFAFEC